MRQSKNYINMRSADISEDEESEAEEFGDVSHGE